MMKKILNISLICMAVFSFFSCEDYLDRSPITELDPGNYFRSENEVRSATLNTYTYLDGLTYLQHEHFTDNCYGKKNSDAISYTHGSHTPSLSIFKTTWEENYKGIAQANLVINADMGADVAVDVINSYLVLNPPRQGIPSAADTFAAQRGLKRLGYYSGRVNGFYDRATLSAVVDYQRKNSLPVTERIDAKLLRRIERDTRAAANS